MGRKAVGKVLPVFIFLITALRDFRTGLDKPEVNMDNEHNICEIEVAISRKFLGEKGLAIWGAQCRHRAIIYGYQKTLINCPFFGADIRSCPR